MASRPRWQLVLAIAFSFVALRLSADNAIQRENRKPGNPEWVLANEASGEIEGYASPLSVNRGEQVRIYVNTVDASYTMNIYRMGWYGGDGARLVAGPITRTGVRQVIPAFDPVTGLVDCNWVDPYVLTIPNTGDATNWASGVYIVRLQSNQTNKTKFVIFYVRDDARVANHLFISSTNTAQAYNAWGGRSLYPDPPTNRPAGRKVSYNRPFDSGGGSGQFLLRWEYHMVRFLEREGYDVTYATDLDVHRRSDLLPNYQSVLFVGHPEYWSWAMRQNTEAARNAGTNLGFFSGNSIYWQIRYEPSAVTGEADRTIVGYKEVALTEDPYATDDTSSNDHLVTTKWRLAPVNRPEAALMGVQYVYNTIINGDIVIDDVTSAPWVFANTDLTQGSILPKLLGYEVDAMAPSSPAGTIRLGSSPFFDENTAQTDYSHMTVYTHTSGATVFATGTIQWSWGLDEWHSDATGAGVVPAAQQMTRNVLARFAGDTAWRDCQYVLAPPEADVPSAAGSGSFTMTTSSNCAWNVATTSPWITITSATTGSGNTTVTYTYTANAAGPRTGDITIGDKSFTLKQKTGCSYTISPTSATAPATGTSGSFEVQTTAPCTWSATSDAAWLTISGAATGQGNGTISYSVAPNDSTQRTGRIVVGGQTFTITQETGCTYTLGASSANVAPSGGTVSVNVTTSSACYWSASSSPSWITITSTNHGPGNGTVTFNVAANTTSFSRVGSLSIAGNAFTVTQAAAGAPTGLSATATSTTSATLTWNPVAGAATYEVARSSNGGFYFVIASTASNSFTNTGLSPNTTYLYEVRAVDGAGNRSAFSLIDPATTIAFTDDPVTIGTPIRAVHLAELRTAVNAMRAAAGLSPRAWTGDAVPGAVIRAVHITELRDALAETRASLSLPAAAYSTPRPAIGTRIRAADINDLRAAVK